MRDQHTAWCLHVEGLRAGKDLGAIGAVDEVHNITLRTEKRGEIQ